MLLAGSEQLRKHFGIELIIFRIRGGEPCPSPIANNHFAMASPDNLRDPAGHGTGLTRNSHLAACRCKRSPQRFFRCLDSESLSNAAASVQDASRGDAPMDVESDVPHVGSLYGEHTEM